MKTILLSTVTLIWLGAVSTFAAAEEMHHEEEREHMHSYAVFLGNTHEKGVDEFTIGLGYEHRLSRHWSIGGFIEHAGGKFDTTVLGIPVFYHLDRHWRFLLAPGVEFHSSNSEFLVRAGVGYEIELHDWTISPEFTVDSVDGEYIQAFGISFGHGF